MNPEELLAHADFVRGLARSLVMDEHRAADITQQTWLAAIEKSPGSVTSLRSWLYKVTRNFTRRHYRSEARRARREEAAAVPEGMPSTEEVVAREELRREVVDAVLALREPYRSTVLLRFYEDLDTREVAERMKVPVETVRTRLKRGLELLRAKLDALHAGDRKAWCLGLAPLAGLKLSPAATTAGTGSLLSGFLAMGTKAKVVLGVFLLAAAAVPLVLWVSNTLRPEDGNAREPVTIFHEESSRGDTMKESTSEPDESEASLEKSLIQPAGTSSPEGLFLSGKVTDRSTGEPVAAYLFSVIRNERVSIFKETIRDDEGRFHIPMDIDGAVTIYVSSSRHLSYQERISIDSGAEENPELNIRLDPGESVSGRVVEDATGRPVAGALVGSSSATYLLNFVLGDVESTRHTRTDDRGFFLLSGLENEWQEIAALHSDFAGGSVKVLPAEGGEIEIRLKPGHRIRGRTLSNRGEPVSDVLIRISGDHCALERMVLVDDRGHFTTPPVRPGKVKLMAGPSPEKLLNHAKPVPFDFSPETKWVEIIDRDVEVCFGPVPGSVTWKGTLYDYDGTPIRNGYISLDPHVPGESSDRSMVSYTGGITDVDGSFEIHKLVPPAYNVSLRMSDNTEVNWGVIRFDEPGVHEKDIRLSSGIVRGVILDGATGTPLEEVGRIVAVQGDLQNLSYYYPDGLSNIDMEGRYCIRNLAPGIYWLAYTRNNQPEIPLRTIEIEEGESIENLRLTLPPLGALSLVVDGLDKNELRLTLSSEEKREYPVPLLGFPYRDLIKKTISLQPGRWTLSLFHMEMGVLEKHFEIIARETVEIHIRENDFKKSAVTLTGQVTRPDGTPVADIQIQIHANETTDLKNGEGHRTATTDSEGRFNIRNVESGSWSVAALVRQGVDTFLPDITIPDNSTDHYFVHLVFPDGKVRGVLYDQGTGRPLSGNERQEHFHLRNVDTRQCAARLGSAIKESRFEMTGLPAGSYQLEIQFPWYWNYRSEILQVNDGQVLDIGEIWLEPCGVLELEVKDAEGTPMGNYKVKSLSLNEFLQTRGRGGCIAEGRYRFNGLPLGKSRIRVSAPGFLDKEVDVFAEERVPVELTVVLEPAGN